MFSLKTIVFHFVSFRERKTSNLLPFEAVETFATECGIYDKSEVINMSHFSYACKTEGENGISRLISETA